MYYYLFEAQHGPKEYERTAQIKELLSTLGIAGEMATPTPGKSVEDLVASAVAKRYSTIIAVGSIDLVNRTAHALEPHDVVFGIIPTHEHPDITRLIGVSDWKSAAEQLKRRRWQPVRMGSMNDQTFFLLPAHIEIPFDASYSIKSKKFTLQGQGGHLVVSPSTTLLLTIDDEVPKKRGFLESLFGKSSSNTQKSHFSLDAFDLQCSLEVSVKVASVPVATTPVRFAMQTKELKLIVGKSSGTLDQPSDNLL